MCQVQIFSRAVGIRAVDRLLRLREVRAQAFARCDNVSPQAKTIPMHLLFQRVETALDGSSPAVELIIFCLQLVQQLLRINRWWLSYLGIGQGSAG